jgi:hypothetical protein
MSRPVLLRKQSVIAPKKSKKRAEQASQDSVVLKPHIRISDASLKSTSDTSIDEALIFARDVAKKAVNADMNNRYQEALQCYRDVNEHLDDILHRLNTRERRYIKGKSRNPHAASRSSITFQEDAPVVFKAIQALRTNYMQRVTTILQYIPIETTTYYASLKISHSYPPEMPPSGETSFNDTFLGLLRFDSHSNYMCEPFSHDKNEAKFEFFTRVSDSITIGAFVLEGLFICPAVWSQSSYKAIGVESKIQALNELTNGLSRLQLYQKMDADVSSPKTFDRAIDEFERTMDASKPLLVKKLKGYNDETPETVTSPGTLDTNATSSTSSLNMMTGANLRNLGNRMSGMLKKPFKYKSKNGETDQMAAYRSILAVFLKMSATIFGHWLKLTRNQSRVNMEIRTRLAKIMRFYQQVVLVIIVNDLTVLLERFARKLKKELETNIPWK